VLEHQEHSAVRRQ